MSCQTESREINTFVPELRIQCLKVISALANKYGYKFTERNLLKRNPRWPLTHLSKQDNSFIYTELDLDLPLRNALAYKPDNNYWKRRALLEFPSLHSQSRGVTSPPVFLSVKKEKREGQHEITGRKVSSKEGKGRPQNEINIVPLPPVTFLTPKRGWLGSYLELLCAQKIEGNSADEVNEVVSLGAAYITSLKLSVALNEESIVDETVSAIPKKLKEVNLFEVLARLTNLKDLSLRVKRKQNSPLSLLTEKRAQPFADSLISNSFTSLSLFESELDDEAANILLQNLCRVNSLKELDLRHNKLTSGMLESLTVLSQNTKLEKIRLDHNFISETSHLCDLLSVSDSLKSLMLDLNPLDDVQSVALLSHLTQSKQSLEFLSMAGCRIRGLDFFWDGLEALLAGGPLIVDASLTEAMSKPLQFLSLASNLFEEPPPQPLIDRLNEASEISVLISSVISPFQVRTPDSTRRTPFLTPSFKELQLTLTTCKEDWPPLILPSLNVEINHGLTIDDNTFRLESEIMNSCFHTKIWKEIV